MEAGSSIWILLIGATILLAAVVDSTSHYARLPNMVGYLAIGWLLRQVDERWDLLGASGRDAFTLLADLGLVVLLFRVGLHSNLQLLIRKLRPAALIWAGNVGLTAVTGYIAARYWAGQSPAASLIIATALTATSIGVAAGAWAANDALNSATGDLMLDVAELDDLSAVLLMAIVIAIVPQLASTQTVVSTLIGAGAGFAAKIAAFAALCYLFAHYVEKPLTEFAATRKRAPQRMLIIAGAGFLIAAGAGALGFSLAIGALFAGLMFSRDPRAIRTESGFDDIHDFFMPFFFVGIGLDTGFDGTTATFVLGAILFVTGVTAKVAGTALPALIFTSRQDALLLGVSMIPRAEIALVVAYQGLNLGTLTEEAYSAVVLASAATCILAPWLITALLRTRSYRQNQ